MYKLKIFGEFQFLDNNNEPVRFRYKKCEELLALLIVSEVPLSRSEIINSISDSEKGGLKANHFTKILTGVKKFSLQIDENNKKELFILKDSLTDFEIDYIRFDKAIKDNDFETANEIEGGNELLENWKGDWVEKIRENIRKKKLKIKIEESVKSCDDVHIKLKNISDKYIGSDADSDALIPVYINNVYSDSDISNKIYENRGNYFIEGVMGSGKSTLLHGIAKLLTKKTDIYILFFDSIWSGFLSEDRLANLLEVNPETVFEIPKIIEKKVGKRIILMIDSLEYIIDSDKLRFFHNLMQSWKKYCSIVITCRSSHTKEAISIIDDLSCERIIIKDWSNADIKRYVKKNISSIPDTFIKNNVEILNRPIILSLLRRIKKKYINSDKLILSDLWYSYYKQIVESELIITTNTESITRDEKIKFKKIISQTMNLLANTMFENKINYINEMNFESILTEKNDNMFHAAFEKLLEINVIKRVDVNSSPSLHFFHDGFLEFLIVKTIIASENYDEKWNNLINESNNPYVRNIMSGIWYLSRDENSIKFNNGLSLLFKRLGECKKIYQNKENKENKEIKILNEDLAWGMTYFLIKMSPYIYIEMCNFINRNIKDINYEEIARSLAAAIFKSIDWKIIQLENLTDGSKMIIINSMYNGLQHNMLKQRFLNVLCCFKSEELARKKLIDFLVSHLGDKYIPGILDCNMINEIFHSLMPYVEDIIDVDKIKIRNIINYLPILDMRNDVKICVDKYLNILIGKNEQIYCDKDEYYLIDKILNDLSVLDVYGRSYDWVLVEKCTELVNLNKNKKIIKDNYEVITEALLKNINRSEEQIRISVLKTLGEIGNEKVSEEIIKQLIVYMESYGYYLNIRSFELMKTILTLAKRGRVNRSSIREISDNILPFMKNNNILIMNDGLLVREFEELVINV